jgi:hypothetical protein
MTIIHHVYKVTDCQGNVRFFPTTGYEDQNTTFMIGVNKKGERVEFHDRPIALAGFCKVHGFKYECAEQKFKLEDLEFHEPLI